MSKICDDNRTACAGCYNLLLVSTRLPGKKFNRVKDKTISSGELFHGSRTLTLLLQAQSTTDSDLMLRTRKLVKAQNRRKQTEIGLRKDREPSPPHTHTHPYQPDT